MTSKHANFGHKCFNMVQKKRREGTCRLSEDLKPDRLLEASRLARNNADWYRLLDLCAITDTLIGDADGLYHPGLFNDRLVLGLNSPNP